MDPQLYQSAKTRGFKFGIFDTVLDKNNFSRKHFPVFLQVRIWKRKSISMNSEK
jgi:hypothetical protein